MKTPIWTTTKADKLFSLFIRNRDKRCMRCGKTTFLQNSHFWNRGHSATRYDEKNCIALCAGCHIFKWEVEKQGEYRDFMLKWLGKKGYAELEKRARSTMKRSDAIIACMRLLNEIPRNN